MSSFSSYWFHLFTVHFFFSNTLKTFYFQKNHLQAIQFSSLKEEVIFPAKIICLLGLQEGEFPRKKSLNFPIHTEYYYPQKFHKDRYSFLKALFLSQDFFIISYRTFCITEGKELLRSSLVEEFISYLEDMYSRKNSAFSQKITYFHPSLNFDALSFSTKNYNQKRRYLSALAYKTPKTPPSFFQIYEPSFSSFSEEKKTLSLKKLELLAKSPLQFFCNESLKIYLEDTKEELFMNYLEKYMFFSESLKKGFSLVFSQFEKQHIFSTGILKEIEKGK